MEIQNHAFSSKWKGYDPEEVKHFLFAIAEDFENLIEQNHRMARELDLLSARVKDMESREKVLKDTLVMAQKVKSEIHENAEKEAELIIKEAQLKADAYYEEAREQVHREQRMQTEVRRVRNDMLAEAEMMVARFSHFVDAERQLADESDKVHNFVGRKARPDEQGVETGT